MFSRVYIEPKNIPVMVAMLTTKIVYTTVFCVPITLRITSIFGKDNDGPANRSARAGPLPIPADINPCSIGTSVKVAKYMNAPKIDAKKLENKEFPPTRDTTH